MEPETRYALSGDVRGAYQVAGDGPRDLVLAPVMSNLELGMGAVTDAAGAARGDVFG